MTRVSSQRVRDIGKLNQRDIRSRSAQGIAAFLAVSTLLFWWWLLAQNQPDGRMVALSTLLLPLWAVGYHLGGRAHRLGGALLAVTGAAALLWLGPLSGDAGVAALLPVPGLVAAAVFGWPAALLAGVPVIGLAAALGAAETGVAGPLAATVTLGVAVLALVPRERILGWSWQRSAEATYLAEQLRDRQGELNKALSQLHLAYQLLERTNRELALARHEAEEARSLKEQFAANVSHELRTPLNIILGFAEIMHRTPEVYGALEWPRMLRRDVAEIWRGARYISELVDDILELARVDALQMPVTREPTDVAALMRETCALAERLVVGKPVRLEVDLPEALPAVPVDKTRIRQVLLNLLSNAIRFTDEGTVHVTARHTGEEVRVTVTDTGVGIPAHEADTIFEEFRRVEGQEARGGKGLGLTIARRFVQLHGGRIWAESEVGQGSAFHFTLPLVDKRVSRLRGTQAVPPGRQSGAVVLLSPYAAEEASAYLARHLEGYTVVATDEVEKLPALVEEHHPLAVLVNSADGVDAAIVGVVAERVRPEVPVVGLSVPVLAPIGADSCFDALLSKPITRDQLVRAVSRFAGGAMLVVDDDRGFVQLVQRLLVSAGLSFEVRWAYDGDEAMEKLSRFRPDVILMDVVMAPVNGAALARLVRAEPALDGATIIAVTGATATLPAGRSRGMQVLKRSGLRDGEALDLLRGVLGQVRADYTPTAPSA